MKFTRIDPDTIECRTILPEDHIGNIVNVGGQWFFAPIGSPLISFIILDCIGKKLQSLNDE